MEKYYVLNEKSLSGSSYPHYFKSLEKAKEKFYELMREYVESPDCHCTPDSLCFSTWQEYFDACWEEWECEDVVSLDVFSFED